MEKTISFTLSSLCLFGGLHEGVPWLFDPVDPSSHFWFGDLFSVHVHLSEVVVVFWHVLFVLSPLGTSHSPFRLCFCRVALDF